MTAETDVVVTLREHHAAVALFTGDGRAYVLDDATSHRWSPETFAPVERAVVVARLRAWADHIEDADRPDPIFRAFSTEVGS